PGLGGPEKLEDGPGRPRPESQPGHPRSGQGRGNHLRRQRLAPPRPRPRGHPPAPHRPPAGRIRRPRLRPVGFIRREGRVRPPVPGTRRRRPARPRPRIGRGCLPGPLPVQGRRRMGRRPRTGPGRRQAGRKTSETPWEILERAMTDGDAAALELWHEYEQATRGCRALVWSPGLRATLGAGQEITDEEAATDEPDEVVTEVLVPGEV